MSSIRKYLGVISGACALLLAGTATGAVVFVDVDSPGPTRDGTSWGTAYQTIVAGVTAAGMPFGRMCRLWSVAVIGSRAALTIALNLFATGIARAPSALLPSGCAAAH